jgi:hypothetical protein
MSSEMSFFIKDTKSKWLDIKIIKHETGEQAFRIKWVEAHNAEQRVFDFPIEIEHQCEVASMLRNMSDFIDD